MPKWYGGSVLNPDELIPAENQWKSQWNRVTRWFERANSIEAKSKTTELSAEDIDDLIAFWQNCYHLRDWISACQPSLTNELTKFFRRHFEMRACRDICNGFKHKRLDRPSLDPDFCLYREYDHFQVETNLPQNPVQYCIAFADGADIRKYDVFDFAQKCFRLWEKFISEKLESGA